MAELVNGHLSEEQLTWHYYGEETSADVELHLTLCRQCKGEFEALKGAMASIDTFTAPTPAPGYEDRLWRAMVRRDASLTSRPAWWRRMMSPWRLAWAGGLAALLLAAFFAGRVTGPAPKGIDFATAPGVARERLLVAALGEHLEQSERMLLEINNQIPGDERQRAENLLAANRLYRQTATMEGKLALAATLEDLERVLLDVAHSPDRLSPDQLRQLRARVDDDGLLFKVKVLGLRLRQLDRQPLPHPSPATSSKSVKG
jgi:hypothetical protein